MEGAKWLAGALAKPLPDKDISENVFRIRALCSDAELAQSLDDLERMKTSASLALQLAQQGSNSRDRAIAEFYVGVMFFRLAEYEQAHLFLEQSLAQFQELHDAYWEAFAYRWLAWLEANQGRPGMPERIQRGLQPARKAGERFILARVLLEYANLLFAKGQTQESRKHLEEIIELSKQLGSNGILLFFAEVGLAQIDWLEGNRQRAEHSL